MRPPLRSPARLASYLLAAALTVALVLLGWLWPRAASVSPPAQPAPLPSPIHCLTGHPRSVVRRSSFNSLGEAAGNLASVNATSPECQPDLSGLPLYSLNLVKLGVDLPEDGAYCYYSHDGIHWTRWPSVGLLFVPQRSG